MQRKRSFVRRRQGSANLYCNFTVDGRRFRDSLDTDDKATAEMIAAKIHSDALLGKVTGKKPELALTHALGRYWLEHGQWRASAGDIKHMGNVLEVELGKLTLLSEISADALAGFAARRRAHLANRSVNIELEHLRAVLNRAGALWGVAIPELPWKLLLLDEAGEREHVLSAEEEERLFAALRPDYHAMVRFALSTGARRANVIGLTWRQIDWQARTITWRVKSPRHPGGDLHVLPLTTALAAILSIERGRHPIRVFTYICQRARPDRHGKRMQRKGQRYPFTRDGWRREWGRALAEANIEDFRFHDLRHSAATRTLRVSGNLRTVQKMLGHKAIATTLRYTKSNVDDIRMAMEAVDRAQPRHTGGAVPGKQDDNSTG
jgi:integrase